MLINNPLLLAGTSTRRRNHFNAHSAEKVSVNRELWWHIWPTTTSSTLIELRLPLPVSGIIRTCRSMTSSHRVLFRNNRRALRANIFSMATGDTGNQSFLTNRSVFFPVTRRPINERIKSHHLYGTWARCRTVAEKTLRRMHASPGLEATTVRAPRAASMAASRRTSLRCFLWNTDHHRCRLQHSAATCHSLPISFSHVIHPIVAQWRHRLFTEVTAA